MRGGGGGGGAERGRPRPADGPAPAPRWPRPEAEARALLGALDPGRLRGALLRPLLRMRVPGTHVRRHLAALGWHVWSDAFEAATPRGPVAFASLVATAAPAAARRLALACHLDSKALPRDARGRPFVGATDAALPCALLLELAAALHEPLRRRARQGAGATLQLLFLDGEEAFGAWSASDSLYGARHLAARMAAQRHPPAGPGATELSAMSLLVLLDLLGAPSPSIHSHFPETQRWFQQLADTERWLHRLGLLREHPRPQLYFQPGPPPGPVEDDHVPFLQRGVPVLHVIPTPFPRVWHTHDDTEDNLDAATVDNLAQILALFVADFLQL
ncbi:glutaminyl-peptide cyclotransferase-like protein [Eudromia elegans]